jgi:AraC-like DNA-binding protein
MPSQSSGTSRRAGTPGLDIFKIAGQSISGFVPSLKTSNPRNLRQPFTSQLEERLALYLEYHPHVRFYQRGDASLAFAQAHRLVVPLGTPYSISYVYDGKAHDYLPDFVGTLSDGGLLIAEAGREVEKRRAQALAKAEAAQRLAALKGGIYWLATEAQLSQKRHYNLLYLHNRRQIFSTYTDIASQLVAYWEWGIPQTVNGLVQRFGSQWSEMEVEAAVWKMVGDAASEGRLLVDLDDVVLDQNTPLALLDPSLPPILPPPLPTSLTESEVAPDTTNTSDLVGDDSPLESQNLIPGPTFDPSILDAEAAKKFNCNINAVTNILAGKRLRDTAQEYGMAPSTLSRLVNRTLELGQIACASYKSYERERALHPEFQQLIRKLYTRPIRPSVMAVYEDVKLTKLATEISTREKKLVQSPTYRQVWTFIKSISDEAEVSKARSGIKHPPRERMSPYSFVLSIPAPALICQVDEHTVDRLVVTPDGTVITEQVHGAALICVKTGAILAAVLSLDQLTEEDYMRLIKQALEPKDRLTTLYECKHRWPCSGKPALIFHDRGKIFTSERATQVIVDRLRIVTEQAPPYAPSVKGTAEALFSWMTRKMEHRYPGTTKSSPQDRGTYDSVKEAEKAGITLDVLEKFFFQGLVDGYMQEWDTLRRQTRIALWNRDVEEYGVARWMGSQDDLKLLLMKAVNRKNPATGRYALHPHRGLSFLGRRYVSPGLLDRLRGKEIDIYYDRRDLSVIYLFLNGEFVGEAYCIEFMGRRVSAWEAQASRKADRVLAKEAAAESLTNRQRIQEEATSGRGNLKRETKRLEQQRQLDLQRSEIHPEHIQTVLYVLAHYNNVDPISTSNSSPILPRAEPEDDSLDKPHLHLAVRKRGDQE